MRTGDVKAMLDLVGQLWPYFADPKHCTDEQNRSLAGLFERFRGTRDQVDAVLRDAYLTHDKGFPPVAKIKAKLDAISESPRATSGGWSEHEQRSWLADRIRGLVRQAGVERLAHDDPRTNINARTWCRHAQRLGLDIAATVADALSISVEDARAQIQAALRQEQAS